MLSFVIILFFCTFSGLFAQNAVSLPDEISRLEKNTLDASQERYSAFLNLARLYRLSGNSEAAIRTYTDALAVFPGDYRVLLEQAQIFISIGEYERAAAAINPALKNSQDRDILLKAQYLAAMLEAAGSSALRSLAVLADDPNFLNYRSGIYYALWNFSGISSWKDRLIAEFPRSPEAKIAGGGASLASSPFWLLFPGRNSLALSNPIPSQAIPAASVQTQSVHSSPSPPVSQAAPAVQPPATAQTGVLLQTGLYSLAREDLAKAQAERLLKAGFMPEITTRKVNGNDYFAVSVRAAGDINAMIKKLKEAGFDSFPVNN